MLCLIILFKLVPGRTSFYLFFRHPTLSALDCWVADEPHLRSSVHWAGEWRIQGEILPDRRVEDTRGGPSWQESGGYKGRSFLAGEWRIQGEVLPDTSCLWCLWFLEPAGSTLVDSVESLLYFRGNICLIFVSSLLLCVVFCFLFMGSFPFIFLINSLLVYTLAYYFNLPWTGTLFVSFFLTHVV